MRSVPSTAGAALALAILTLSVGCSGPRAAAYPGVSIGLTRAGSRRLGCF